MMRSPRVPDALIALAARRRAIEDEVRQSLRLPSVEELFREWQARQAPQPKRAETVDSVTIGDDDDFC